MRINDNSMGIDGLGKRSKLTSLHDSRLFGFFHFPLVPLTRKLRPISFSLFFAGCLAPSAVSFVPTAAVRTGTSLKATIEEAKLIPPKKIADLANTAEELYSENVQKTYG